MLGETSRLCVYWGKTVAVCYVEKEHGHGESGSSQLSNLPRFCRFACPSPSEINPQWKSLRDEGLSSFFFERVGRTFVREVAWHRYIFLWWDTCGAPFIIHEMILGYVQRAFLRQYFFLCALFTCPNP